MLLLSCQSFSVSLATPTSRDYCIMLYVTMTILPDDFTVMARHNSRIGHTGTPGLWIQELDAELWTLDSGLWTLDAGAGLWTLTTGR